MKYRVFCSLEVEAESIYDAVSSLAYDFKYGNTKKLLSLNIEESHLFCEEPAVAIEESEGQE